MSDINTATYYRMSHVTGPGCVLVSLKFGTPPVNGPSITIRTDKDVIIDPQMDVDAYVIEVLEGVAEANRVHGTSVTVEEIEIVPDDFPTRGQVFHCAKKLAEHYISANEE